MELPAQPAVTGDGDGRQRTPLTRGTEGTQDARGATVVTVARTNPLYGHDAPLISVTAAGEPDPVIAAIARFLAESGSVYLELPDGRLTVVLDLDGTTWVPRAADEGTRG